MIGEEVLARRRALNKREGDEFLTDVNAQRDLRFTWDGRTIRDELHDPPFTYMYPSAIGTSLFYHGMFEPGEIAFMNVILAQLEAPLILDVGANIGHHAVSWCRSVPTALCRAFEPVPANVELLRRNAESAGVSERMIVDMRAVDRASGTARLREARDPAYSTLNPDASVVSVAEYDVSTVSIDAYVRECAIARIDLLKIDVEGAESSVLAGAEHTLERDAPFLLVEISAARGAVAAEELLRTLIERGYRAYAFTNGVVTACDGTFDDTVRNYAFLPVRRPIALPITFAPAARAEAAAAIRIMRGLQARAESSVAELAAKDKEIRSLKSAADERLVLIDTSAHAIHEEMELQGFAAAERLRVIEELNARVIELERELAQARGELETRRDVAPAECAEFVRHIAFQEATIRGLADEIEKNLV